MCSKCEVTTFTCETGFINHRPCSSQVAMTEPPFRMDFLVLKTGWYTEFHHFWAFRKPALGATSIAHGLGNPHAPCGQMSADCSDLWSSQSLRYVNPSIGLKKKDSDAYEFIRFFTIWGSILQICLCFYMVIDPYDFLIWLFFNPMLGLSYFTFFKLQFFFFQTLQQFWRFFAQVASFGQNNGQHFANNNVTLCKI